MKIKQIISAILAVTLFMSVTALADNEAAYAVGELKSYSIMTSDNTEEFVTRAEMALVSLRLQGIGNSVSGQSKFADVPDDHKYAGAISVATELGIFAGFSDGMFYPDRHITAYQAIKVITVSLGYEEYAQTAGGYPWGYISAANKIGLTDKTDVLEDRELRRGELALMLVGCLDEYPMERTYGAEISWSRSSLTVREILSERTGTAKIEGIVFANEHTVLDGETTLDKGQVRINNAVYKVGNTNIAQCLGMNVTVFVDEKSGGVIPTITHFYVNDEQQSEKIFDSNDVTYVAKGVLKTYENDKEKTYRLKDDAAYIYNGKSINPSDDKLKIYEGCFRLTDYDRNGVYDVMFITEKENFVVEKTYLENVYFSGESKFRGVNGINLESDDDNFVEIYNPDGVMCTVKNILPQMGITLVCSEDKSLIKVYLSDGIISGTVTETDASNYAVCVDGKSYKLALNCFGKPMTEPIAGMKYDYVLSYDGKIITEISDAVSQYEYGYVTAFSDGGTFMNSGIQVIKSGIRTSETKTSGGVTTVSHKVQNGEMTALYFADKVNFNGVKTESQDIGERLMLGKAIAYKLDSSGRIKTINTYDVSGGLSDLKLNTDIFAFGGYLGAQSFVVGEETKLICVPEDIKRDDDYYVLVTLRDNADYSVYPIAIDEETQIAEAVILVEKMDSLTPGTIDSDIKASIVGKVSRIIDSDGNSCYKIQILTGDTVSEIICNDDSDKIASAVAGLSTGDVIRYSLNASGRLDNIEVLASLYNVKEYFRTNPNTLREKVFGQCYEIKRHRLSEGLNEYVDKITLRTGMSSTAYYEVLCTDGPHYYIFEKKLGIVKRATSDDVLDYVNVGDYASDVYMFVKDSEPQVVVIVK